MIKKIFLIASSMLLCMSISNLSYASHYQHCKKWAINIIAVVCKDNLEGQHAASKLAIKQLNKEQWEHYSTNEKYPFSLLLPGPGLDGPHVNNYGYVACDAFCMQNQ